MKKREFRSVIAIGMILVGLLLSSLACDLARFLPVGELTARPIATPSVPTTATKAAPARPRGEITLEDLPIYPGAQRDLEKEDDLAQLGAKFGPLPPELAGGEFRVYVTSDAPAKVVDFYLKEMKRLGWPKRLGLTTEQGGLIIWERPGETGGVFQAVALIGAEEEGGRAEIVIILGLNLLEGEEALPGPTPSAGIKLPAGESLLPTPPLAQGIAGWEQWLQGGSYVAGHNEVRMVGDPTYEKVVEFSRTSGGSDGGAAGIYQSLNVDVSGYRHLYVWLVGKVLHEEGGNLANSNPRWFPEGAVQVRIRYLTADEKEQEWYHGFYSQPVDRADAEHFTKVTRGEWFTYISPDLMTLPEPPQRITDFRVYGFGWEFQGQVAEADLIGSSVGQP